MIFHSVENNCNLQLKNSLFLQFNQLFEISSIKNKKFKVKTQKKNNSNDSQQKEC